MTLAALIAFICYMIMIVLVAARVLQLRRLGLQPVMFGRLDKSDFLLPPFALFYTYLVTAATFGLPMPATRLIFHPAQYLVGILMCLLSVAIFAWGLASFGRSFRIGIDPDQPGVLVTTGAFAFSRNPLYLAFFFILIGHIFIYGHWVFLIFFIGAALVVHRQVLREEAALQWQYGQAYSDYQQKVSRYL